MNWGNKKVISVAGGKGGIGKSSVSVGLALASLTTMVLLASPSSVERVYLGTDTRAASMLIGAALASWLAWRGPVL